MKEVWGMAIQASRCIHKVIGVMEWLIGLKCAPDIILLFFDTATEWSHNLQLTVL